ncbi:MAG TPA: diacylglycerol kinase family protein, partial [Acidimicrobiales bacterium]|nr:diacylglycerol kinase family protein [Acidimicrobiales bacterium]
MKLLFIVNTSASSVTERARVVIQKALSADHDVTTALTSRRGHATRLAQGAASQRLDAVVVLGGDGTLNEAANGLAGSSTALGILPGGSTNVYARTLGLAADPVEATGELLGAMARGSTRRVGLGSVNDRYFLFHVGVGFDAAVVEQVEKRAALKRYASHPLFVYSAFLTWFRHYDRGRPRFAVQFPDGADSSREVVDDGYFAICLKTNPYTYLGTTPLNVAPEATLDSPLVLVTFRSLSMYTLLGAATAALRSRSLRKRRRLDYRTDLPGFTLVGHGPVPYQVDGDFLGETDRL